MLLCIGGIVYVVVYRGIVYVVVYRGYSVVVYRGYSVCCCVEGV